MVRIAVFVSGNGSLLPTLFEAVENGRLPARISCVISDRIGAPALDKAEAAGYPALCLDRRQYRDPRGISLSDALLREVKDQADYIVLAGFLSILQGRLLEAYEGRIINIHPALLPKHGGRGMYGIRVHQAVIDSGDTSSGTTVHYVTAGVDTGPVILQREVEISPGETAESLQRKVHEIEGDTLVEALQIVLTPSALKRGVVQ